MTEELEQPHDRIFNILFQEDELTWQNIIYDLVRQEEMDPWNINISLITQKFLEKLKLLKNMDFRISGKVVLASALLLKMKSSRLLDKDLAAFDSLLSSSEEDFTDVLEELTDVDEVGESDLPKIHPRIPQPRKRKVSVFDLVEALEKALEVENRRKRYFVEDVKVETPKKTREISLIIKDVYEKIASYFQKSTTKLTFDQLIPSDSKEDKVFTFIPLLHLDFQRKIELMQKEHFGEISIILNKKKQKEVV
ncbi:MAG: segregation/condensation protein A [Nanoarchaeota archaeon]|nr:segregation/condensation protein A [Nanoarchaeota archaeon]MBU1854764.1 segregation/condensation protein A [Nanoarchaeota archaeon]